MFVLPFFFFFSGCDWAYYIIRLPNWGLEMRYPFQFEALFLLLFVLHRAWAELPIYIDLVPDYGNLSDCAEPPLHDIVRNMASGCGDGSHLTSYTCFCTDSYSKFLYDISTAVSSQCTSTNPKAQATSVLKVFEEYCVNGESYRLNMSGPSCEISSSP